MVVKGEVCRSRDRRLLSEQGRRRELLDAGDPGEASVPGLQQEQLVPGHHGVPVGRVGGARETWSVGRSFLPGT